MAAFLRRHSIRFRRHVRSLPGTPDFVLIDFRTVLFVNGCFWHGHQACAKGLKLPTQNAGFWRAKIERNRRRDRRVARALRARGYSVLTVWECRLQAEWPHPTLKQLVG